jgi:hypothetical protein
MILPPTDMADATWTTDVPAEASMLAFLLFIVLPTALWLLDRRRSHR